MANCSFDLILVIDESGSMRRDSRAAIADAVLREFINQMGDKSRIGVIDFDTSAESLQDLASKSELQSQIDRLVAETRSSGGTDLETGIGLAKQVIASRTTLTSNPTFIAAITDVTRYPGSDVDFAIMTGISTSPNYGSKLRLNALRESDAPQIVSRVYSIICPQPQDVDVEFKTTITPTIPTDQLEASEILLDGKSIGKGQALIKLLEGTTHTVEFKKPHHPDYTFSDGKPMRASFTVPTGGRTVESVFVATKNPTGYLTIKTTYSPSISDKNLHGEILLNGTKPLNLAIPQDPDSEYYVIGTGESAKLQLTPGNYVISFKDIKVSGMVYKTPPPVVVNVKEGDNQVITREYVGKYIPPDYWLKEIEDINKRKIKQEYTVGMFSDNISNLTSFFTASNGESLDRHYTHVYHENPDTSATSSIQFSLAYGHYAGSGSNDEGGQISDTPTRAIYGQYRSIVLGTADSKFNLTGEDTDSIYVLSFQKDRRFDGADINALEVNLAHLSGSEYIAGNDMSTHTGSNVQLSGTGEVLRLITDSKISDGDRTYAGTVYNIVSGSIEDGVYSGSSPHYYGKLYSDLGFILLDGVKLDASASFGTVTTREVDGDNTKKLFKSISGSAQFTDASGDVLGMKARSTEQQILDMFFLEVRNWEFNYSNNPTFRHDTNGSILPDFQKQPITYPTSIGLYNENKELVAIGKVSSPEKNSFTEEVSFAVKLKY